MLPRLGPQDMQRRGNDTSWPPSKLILLMYPPYPIVPLKDTSNPYRPSSPNLKTGSSYFFQGLPATPVPIHIYIMSLSLTGIVRQAAYKQYWKIYTHTPYDGGGVEGKPCRSDDIASPSVGKKLHPSSISIMEGKGLGSSSYGVGTMSEAGIKKESSKTSASA